MNEDKDIKLTQFSHGAGCGCKLSPSVLSSILAGSIDPPSSEKLLVGYGSCDDAAVYDLGDGTAVISTTDFFMPIVDDPFMFGVIAATNAISDIYAMGGSPLLAIAILGWPIDKLDPEIARSVVDGGRQACKNAGIPLAGGHSIDSPEPIFGLAVTGRVDISNLKQNNTATKDCVLFLTKPLGVGVFSTAGKQGILDPSDAMLSAKSMMELNMVGTELGLLSGVKAMTDVTGFGLLGHLREMCEGSAVSALIYMDKIPFFNSVWKYIDQKCIPGGTYKNWKSYGHCVRLSDNNHRFLLCDPQTSGGLLVACEKDCCDELVQILKKYNLHSEPIGHLTECRDVMIEVV